MIQPHHRFPARFEDPVNTILRCLNKLYSLWLQATYPFAFSGRKLSIHFPCELSRRIAHQIKLGNSVLIRKDTWLNIVPGLDSELKIIIDDNCVIGRRSSISAKNSIHIERDVILSSSVLIHDHAHAYEDINLPIRDQGVTRGGKIRIEQGCWIGSGSSIMCNGGELVVGRNSVIGAEAVITKSVPPYSVVVGNPGRVVKHFDLATEAWVAGPVRTTGIGLSEPIQGRACLSGQTQCAILRQESEVHSAAYLNNQEATNG
jgi:acetyltransferase-like isoleucine patch superfamily enzyme